MFVKLTEGRHKIIMATYSEKDGQGKKKSFNFFKI